MEFQLSPRMNKDQSTSGYTGFLQEQVQRLSAVLKEYQRKYPPIKEPKFEDGEQLPPWLDDPSVLSPLLIEYDANIKALKDQVILYKKEQETWKEKTDKIIEENNRLHEELRRSIENQLDALQQVEGISGDNQDSIDTMQRQLRLLGQEKENFKSLWENATSELNTAQTAAREKSQELAMRDADIAALQDDLRKARSFAEDMQRDKHRIKLEQEQFLLTAESQDKEMEHLRDELRRTMTELKTFKLRNEELTKHLDNLQSQVKLLDRDTQKAIGEEKSSEGTIRELQNAIVELESRCTSMMKEIGKLQAEKEELEEGVATLQKKSAELEDREYQATLHVRDSVQLVENALLEREQIAIKEQQLSQEVTRLQENMSNILKEADKKKRTELESQRAQHNRQTQRLMEEIHYLEMEGAEKQAQLERALREKATVEKELEKVYSEGPSEASRAGSTLEELQRRLAKVEVSRDEVLQQNESLLTSMRQTENYSENEKNFLKSQVNESKKRIKTLEEEVETMSNSKLQLLDEIDQLKRNAISSNKLKEEADMAATADISSLKQKLEMQSKDFESRIKATENLNRQSVSELREMLSAQQRIGNKWRDESRTMTQKFESTINELKQQASRTRSRNDDLTKRLLSEQQRSDKMEQELMESRAAQEKLQRMAADSEARADAASAQVQTLLNRERQLLQERKELNRKIDQLEMEISRASRQKTSNNWKYYGDDMFEKEDYKHTSNGYYT